MAPNTLRTSKTFVENKDVVRDGRENVEEEPMKNGTFCTDVIDSSHVKAGNGSFDNKAIPDQECERHENELAHPRNSDDCFLTVANPELEDTEQVVECVEGRDVMRTMILVCKDRRLRPDDRQLHMTFFCLNLREQPQEQKLNVFDEADHRAPVLQQHQALQDVFVVVVSVFSGHVFVVGVSAFPETGSERGYHTVMKEYYETHHGRCRLVDFVDTSVTSCLDRIMTESISIAISEGALRQPCIEDLMGPKVLTRYQLFSEEHPRRAVERSGNSHPKFNVKILGLHRLDVCFDDQIEMSHLEHKRLEQWQNIEMETFYRYLLIAIRNVDIYSCAKRRCSEAYDVSSTDGDNTDLIDVTDSSKGVYNVTVWSVLLTHTPDRHADDQTADRRADDKSSDRHADDQTADRHADDKSSARHADDQTADRHADDKSSDRHAGGKSSDRHADDQTADRHADDKSSARHADDQTADRHADDKSSDRHAGDKSSDRHADDQTADRHADDKSSDRHVDDKSSDRHTDDQTADRHADDKSSDRLTDDQTSDRHADDKTLDRHTDDQGSDRHADEQTADRHAGDQTPDRDTDDQTSDRHADDQTLNRHTDDQGSDRHSDEQTSDRHADDQTLDRHTDDQGSDRHADEQTSDRHADEQTQESEQVNDIRDFLEATMVTGGSSKDIDNSRDVPPQLCQKPRVFVSKESYEGQDRRGEDASFVSLDRNVEKLFYSLTTSATSQSTPSKQEQTPTRASSVKTKEKETDYQDRRDLPRTDELYPVWSIPAGSRNMVVAMMRSSSSRKGETPTFTITHQGMEHEWNRLATFHSINSQVFVLPIAQAGFFLTRTTEPLDSEQAEVECAFCGVTVALLAFVRHNAMAVHRERSPSCEFLQGHSVGNVSVAWVRETSGNQFLENCGPLLLGRAPQPSQNCSAAASFTATSSPHTALDTLVDADATAMTTAIEEPAVPALPPVSSVPTLKGPDMSRRSERSPPPSRPGRQGGNTTSGQSAADSAVPVSSSSSAARQGVNQSATLSETTAAARTDATSGTATQRSTPGNTPQAIGTAVSDSAVRPNAAGSLSSVSGGTAQVVVPSVPEEAPRGTPSGQRGQNSGEDGQAGGQERQMVTYEDLGIYAQRPKRPDMAVKATRINTFENWPHGESHPRELMAEAGFYFTGHLDLVRCFHCKGGLKTWERSDQPWIEHCRWFPRCPFVRICKGQRFVDAVQRLNNPEARPAISEREVRREMRRMDIEDRSNLGDDVVLFSNQTPPPPEQDPALGALARAGLRVDATVTEGSMTDMVEQLEDENEEMRVSTLCKVCQINDVNVLSLPCGHLVSCGECASVLRTCAICRQEVKGSVRVYLDETQDDEDDDDDDAGQDLAGLRPPVTKW